MTIIFHPINPLAPITSGIWVDALATLNRDIADVQTQLGILQDQMYAHLPRDAASGPYTLAVRYGDISETAPSIVSPILMVAATYGRVAPVCLGGRCERIS